MSLNLNARTWYISLWNCGLDSYPPTTYLKKGPVLSNGFTYKILRVEFQRCKQLFIQLKMNSLKINIRMVTKISKVRHQNNHILLYLFASRHEYAMLRSINTLKRLQTKTMSWVTWQQFSMDQLDVMKRKTT